jgi:hypothetical protein
MQVGALGGRGTASRDRLGWDISRREAVGTRTEAVFFQSVQVSGEMHHADLAWVRGVHVGALSVMMMSTVA